jgi:hypothetical protein
MLSIAYFRTSAILSVPNVQALRRKITISQQARSSAVKALRRVLPASMRHCGNFRLDKRSRPKVKVSVRNYTAIRRFFNKKASGC